MKQMMIVLLPLQPLNNAGAQQQPVEEICMGATCSKKTG